MPDLPTFDELYAAGQAEVIDRRPDFTDWEDGSSLDAITGGGAVIADEVVRVLVDLFAAQFADTAEGEDLDAYASDRFGLTRTPDVAAVGEVTFTRDAYVGAFTAAAGTTVNGEVNGEAVTVTTDVDAVFGAGDNSVTVAATSTQTGRQGNVDAGVLDTVVDPPVEDPGLAVTNADRFAGGAPEESDEQLRGRIRRYFTTLRKGVVAALEAGAKNVAGVQFATVDESTVPPDVGGYVSVYIGDPEGAGNATLATLVDAELINWRAAGIEVRVFPAEREEIALAMTLYVRRGANRTALLTAAAAAVVAYADGLDPKATLYLAQAESAAIRVSRDVLSADVTSHTADIVPSANNYALRIPAASLALTVVEVG